MTVPVFPNIPFDLKHGICRILYQERDWQTIAHLAHVSQEWKIVAARHSSHVAYLSTIELTSNPCVLLHFAPKYSGYVEMLDIEVSAHSFRLSTHILPHDQHAGIICKDGDPSNSCRRISAHWHDRLPWITELLRVGRWHNVKAVRFRLSAADCGGRDLAFPRNSWKTMLGLVPRYLPSVSAIDICLPGITYESVATWVRAHCPQVTCLDFHCPSSPQPSSALHQQDDEDQPAAMIVPESRRSLGEGRFERLSTGDATVTAGWLSQITTTQPQLRELHLRWFSTRELVPWKLREHEWVCGTTPTATATQAVQSKEACLPSLLALSLVKVDIDASCIEIPVSAVHFPRLQSLTIGDITAGFLSPLPPGQGGGGGGGSNDGSQTRLCATPISRVFSKVFSQVWHKLIHLHIPAPSNDLSRQIVKCCPALKSLKIDGYYRLETPNFTKQSFLTLVQGLPGLTRLTIPGHNGRQNRDNCDDLVIKDSHLIDTNTRSSSSSSSRSDGSSGSNSTSINKSDPLMWSCTNLRYLSLRAPLSLNGIVRLIDQFPYLQTLEVRIAIQKHTTADTSNCGLEFAKHTGLKHIQLCGSDILEAKPTLNALLEALPNLQRCSFSCGLLSSQAAQLIKTLKSEHIDIQFLTSSASPSKPDTLLL
ncbi:hypothetical protein H4219_001858 [Mycoemilia scoparia]|uniref:F-box domain-containing protein n=1 Tax=Mycoemilia scoparia TaxID=417184 RepID=A0A9W8DPV0_9FUNG|nr:hypothetical protein H4219_001858 [Mycoemilia scoparia]